jgi:hypothetical protein
VFEVPVSGVINLAVKWEQVILVKGYFARENYGLSPFKARIHVAENLALCMGIDLID